MKSIIKNIIFPVLASGIFFYGVQSLVEYYSRSDGAYQMLLYQSNDEYHALIQISNESTKSQNDFKFFVSDIKNVKLSHSRDIQCELIYDSKDSSHCFFIVPDVYPRVSCYIDLSGLTSNSTISFLNAEDLGYSSYESLVNKQLNSKWLVVMNSILYTVILGITMTLLNVHTTKRYEQENKTLRDKLQQLTSNVEDIGRSYKSLMKHRLLLLARIRDYEKELNFWQTTISKILLKSKLLKPKTLFNMITTELKTFGTKASDVKDLSFAEYIAKIISKEQ
jgi:hypothetical protein